MTLPQILAGPIGDFLYEWRFNNRMGVNPGHRPLSAASRCGLYSLIRIAVPACGKSRDATIASAVRFAGYRVIENETGLYVERIASRTRESSKSDDDHGAKVENGGY